MQKLKITEMNRLSVDAYKQETKLPLVVVLDNVRSMNNIGSIFRTADAFLIERIILCGITATPPHPDIRKTALGAEDSVDWQYFENTLDAIQHLAQEGYTLLAIEQAKESTQLDNLVLMEGEKYAIILGNEVKGVQQSVVDACHACVEIPQYGTKHSLNVSISGGIVIWEMFKKFNWK